METNIKDLQKEIDDLMEELGMFPLNVNKMFSPKPKKIYQTYLFKDNSNNYIKIGRSIDYLKRYDVLSSINLNIKILFIIDADVEAELHKEYKSKRIHSEWFNLTEKDINNIKTKYKNHERINKSS